MQGVRECPLMKMMGSSQYLKKYKSNKTNEEQDNEDNIDDEEIVDTKDDQENEEECEVDEISKGESKKPELTAKPKVKIFRDQYYREKSIREIEVTDFLQSSGLDSIENQIINLGL